MVYIIIPVHNRISYTIPCIESLLKQAYREAAIILVDDGSTDGTSETVERLFPNVVLIKGDGSWWWTGATNKGVEYALSVGNPDEDFVLCLNNDLIVKEDYLQELINLSRKYPKAILGSLSVDIKSHAIHDLGMKWDSFWAHFRPALAGNWSLKAIQEKTELIETSLLPGRGTLIPMHCFREIGLFDFENFPQYAADNDFSLRAAKAGYPLLLSTKAVVYSHVNATGLKMEQRQPLFKHFKKAYTSIRSPLNLKIRYKWARKHATSPAILYFLIDFTRITKSILINRLKTT